MLRVIICDDEYPVRAKLREYMLRRAKARGLALEILEYESGEALLSGQTDRADILLLDIQMRGMTGMDAPRRIRSGNQDMCIIFITNLVRYAVEGYEVQAFRFLKKPVTYKEFDAVAGGAALLRSVRKAAFISVKNDRGLFRLPVENIYY